MISTVMDFQISPEDIERTHGIGVPKSGKNRSIIVQFIRYNDRRQIFTDKKRLKEKDSSINESLKRIWRTELNKARNNFGFRSVWTSDRKIMYRVEGDTKAKICFE